MTKKGIPEKKRFTSLLNQFQGDEKRFIEADRQGYPKFKALEGTGVIGHEFLSEKVYYCHCVKDVQSGEVTEVACRKEYVQLIMVLQGQISIAGYEGAFFELFPNTVQLVKYGNGEVNILSPKEERLEVFVVNVHKSLIGPEKAYFENLMPFVQDTSPASLETFSPIPFPIGYQMRQIVEELAQKKYSGCFLGHFIEIKIMELLLLYINEWTISKEKSLQESQTKDQRISQQMEQVRALLLGNLSDTPGLKSLASAVGTNEFHLKQYFKAYFGKTVMAYLREYKMEKAKTELMETNRKINDIAESLGYKHATHFSAAFKKYHGKLPKDFR